jgi:uncharacterized membrane protein
MTWEVTLRWLHVIGACVLLGTGAGIAFFMLAAVRTARPALIAHVASTVVIADLLFTATAVVAQPVTGYLLARKTGWALTEGWIVLSLALYVVTGLFWLPVVRIQIRLRDLARMADEDGAPCRIIFTVSTESGMCLVSGIRRGSRHHLADAGAARSQFLNGDT